MESEQQKSERIDLRGARTVTKKIGGKRVTFSRPKSKTHRGGVSILITIDGDETPIDLTPRAPEK
jgi:hypothetical protein